MLDDSGKPTDGFLIRFKRTGLAPFKTHLQRHHINRRPLPGGKRGNVPLFAFEVTMRLDLAENGNYATPVLERGNLLSKELIAQLADSRSRREASEKPPPSPSVQRPVRAAKWLRRGRAQVAAATSRTDQDFARLCPTAQGGRRVPRVGAVEREYNPTSPRPTYNVRRHRWVTRRRTRRSGKYRQPFQLRGGQSDRQTKQAPISTWCA